MQKLINSRGPIEDPSPVACASRSLILGQTEGLLSYKATSSLIASSNCCFSNWDVDLHLLELLKVCRYIVSVSFSSRFGYIYVCIYVLVHVFMYIYA